MKKWLAVILGLMILAFIFADSLFYLTGRWQEKTGKIKRAGRIYSRLIKKYPRSRWVSGAKEAIERLKKSPGAGKKGEAQTSKPVAPYVGVLKRAEKKVKDIDEKKEKEYEKWLEDMEE